MTEAELQRIRSIIETHIAETRSSLPYLAEESKAVEPNVSLGRLTRMEAISDKSVNEEIQRQAKARLEKLLAALDRLDKGVYGVCLRCSKEIPLGRLEIVPEAFVCVECASRPR